MNTGKGYESLSFYFEEFIIISEKCVKYYVSKMTVVFLRLGDSPASEFYVPTFRNTLLVPSL